MRLLHGMKMVMLSYELTLPGINAGFYTASCKPGERP